MLYLKYIKKFYKTLFVGIFFFFFFKFVIFNNNCGIFFDSLVFCEIPTYLVEEKSDLYKFCEMFEHNTRQIEEKIINTKDEKS